MKKVFLVTIETKNDTKEWDYEPNTEIIIPVFSSSEYHAILKLENRYQGSEYPFYRVKSVTKCDTFLFKPILK